jgi:chromate transporter
LADLLYRSGLLVFGGGHVVLPLLRSALVPAGWIGDAQFLAGYGAVQALPGPLFSVAAFVGAAVAPPQLAIVWACGALIAIFAPGMLLAVGGMSIWRRLAAMPWAGAALAGLNAAVVGVLAAALYNPLGKTAILSPLDLLFAFGAWWLLTRWKWPPLAIVALALAASIVGAWCCSTI